MEEAAGRVSLCEFVVCLLSSDAFESQICQVGNQSIGGKDIGGVSSGRSCPVISIFQQRYGIGTLTPVDCVLQVDAANSTAHPQQTMAKFGMGDACMLGFIEGCMVFGPRELESRSGCSMAEQETVERCQVSPSGDSVLFDWAVD
jgi:hypothetical protein